MADFTIETKQLLADAALLGIRAYTVSYNPNTVVGDIEGDVVASGLFEFFRFDSANIVTVIYTSAFVAGGTAGGGNFYIDGDDIIVFAYSEQANASRNTAYALNQILGD